MKQPRRLTRREKKRKYKTPARWEEAKRKKGADELNKELNYGNEKDNKNQDWI